MLILNNLILGRALWRGINGESLTRIRIPTKDLEPPRMPDPDEPLADDLEEDEDEIEEEDEEGENDDSGED